MEECYLKGMDASNDFTFVSNKKFDFCIDKMAQGNKDVCPRSLATKFDPQNPPKPRRVVLWPPHA